MTLSIRHLFLATRSIVAFGALLIPFCGSTAFANTITFNDLWGAPVSVTLTGVTGATSVCSPSGVTLETCTVTVPQPFPGNPGVSWSQWDIYDANGTLSDTIAVNVASTNGILQATITFSSGEPGSGLTALGANYVLEDGTVQTVGGIQWFYPPAIGTVVDTIQFQSNDSPEPATTMLIGGGLLGMGILLRRRRVTPHSSY
jgi:hypothetical protein